MTTRQPTYEELRVACEELVRSRDLLLQRNEAQQRELSRLLKERTKLLARNGELRKQVDRLDRERHELLSNPIFED